MEHNKIVKYGIIISIIEIIFIGIWFYIAKPELRTALAILKITLVLFGINLILGLILYFLKERISVLFFGNSIFCPFVFYAFWIMWFTYWAK